MLLGEIDFRTLPLSHELLQLIAEVDEFKGQWEVFQMLSPERLTALRRVATIESIGSSTRIEGVRLSDGAIATLLAGLETGTFRSRDEEEVAGYAAAMELVYQAWDSLTLTENHLQQLHGVLLRHSAKDTHHRGRYKRAPNHVVAYAADGREIGVIFETATPFATPLAMARLVTATQRALTQAEVHPLLVMAAFVVSFLAIHPFQDGNGRLSRILTTLLLLRAGYAYVPYASLESVVEENKELYYAALRQTQVTLTRPAPEWSPWVGFFLRCLQQQKRRLAAKLERERLLTGTLPELARRIVTLVKEQGNLTAAQLQQLTGANRNTLKMRLRTLVAAGHLKQNGQGKATWYSRHEIGPGGPEKK